MQTLERISTLLVSLSLISVIITIHLKKQLYTYTDHNNVSIQVYTAAKKTIRLNKFANCLSILLTVASLISIFTYSYINQRAIDCGAYNNIQLSQSINDVLYYTDNGYTESDNIPSDLSGKLVIFYRYGCPDCAAIHNELIKYLSDNNIDDIYFVSSKSTVGKKLLYPYSDKDKCLIDQVPSIVYYYKNSSDPNKIASVETLFEFQNKHISLKTRTLEHYIQLRKDVK